MKQSAWCRHCDVTLGYRWPSDDMSEGRSSASEPQLTVGNWNHRKWSHGWGDYYKSYIGRCVGIPVFVFEQCFCE